MKARQKMWLYGTAGMIATGAGLSVVGEATSMRINEAATLHWVSMGTLGLVLFNTGLGLLTGSVFHRVQHRRRKEQTRRKRPRKKNKEA